MLQFDHVVPEVQPTHRLKKTHTEYLVQSSVLYYKSELEASLHWMRAIVYFLFSKLKRITLCLTFNCYFQSLQFVISFLT